MVVVLAASFVPPPGASTETAQPVIRRSAVRTAVGPHVPLALGIRPRRAALLKPRMLIGRMVGNEIQNQADASLVQQREETVKIFKFAEPAIDGTKVGNIIAHIQHGRTVD